MSVDVLIDQAVLYLQESYRAVALTGAGISTPSGIPDFRSPGSGMWEQHDLLSVANIEAFKRRPQDFYEWIHPLARLVQEAAPNPAHFALKDLENYGPLEAIITQNIDMLHHQAGSQNIYEVHGHLREATCMGCGYVTDVRRIWSEFVSSAEIPHCEFCHDVLKPNITLFGEVPPWPVLQAAETWAATCDLLLVAGSSLEVLPVADLPLLAKQNDARLIVVNYMATYIDERADVVIHGDVAEVLPQLAAPFIMN
ncbi:MAG: NAD-dependent deacylase [Candidatus Promineifilaceae bacterium]|nr:NAD-dependent deacylase [Candidatus Promineifilaceae bacterium]